MISSNAGSGVHWPTRSEKSALRVRPMVARVSSSITTWIKADLELRGFVAKYAIHFRGDAPNGVLHYFAS